MLLVARCQPMGLERRWRLERENLELVRWVQALERWQGMSPLAEQGRENLPVQELAYSVNQGQESSWALGPVHSVNQEQASLLVRGLGCLVIQEQGSSLVQGQVHLVSQERQSNHLQLQ